MSWPRSWPSTKRFTLVPPDIPRQNTRSSVFTQPGPKADRQDRGGYGGSPLRQAGQAQAGDIEFEKFRCHIVSQVAKSGDGQLRVDGKHATEFGACLVKAAEMGIGGNFDPHRCD